jgi:hypothetical protein
VQRSVERGKGPRDAVGVRHVERDRPRANRGRQRRRRFPVAVEAPMPLAPPTTAILRAGLIGPPPQGPCGGGSGRAGAWGAQ